MAKTAKKKTGTKKTKKRESKQRFKNRIRLLKLFAFLVITFLIYIGYCFLTLPDIEHAIYRDRQPATTVLDDNGNEIQSFGTVYSDVIYLDELPSYVPEAIIATEDRRFYSHFGFDVIGFVRAMVRNIMARSYVQGGSTITQQVAKNLFLTPQKNIKRKTQELLLAFWLEYKFSKKQILTLYLNRVYLGSGTYGIEAASKRYFRKSSRDLNLLEASVIAGMLKAPSRYNPIASEQRARERAKVILNNMVKNGYLTKEEAEAALKYKIGHDKNIKIDSSKYFADWIYKSVNESLGEREEDIIVLSTLDTKLQGEAEKILNRVIEANKQKNVTQGAIIVMDYFGGIKAMVGGVNYNKSQFNRVTQALRQPGSSFKPFVYLTALEKGYSTMDKIADYPITIGKWKPENYDKKYYGEVTLLHALTKSLNLATISLAETVGRKNIINNAKKLGITSKINNSPSLALGTFEVNMLDMLTAYAAIANRGYPLEPYGIEAISTKDGKVFYSNKFARKERVVDKQIALMMKEMMQNVVDNGTGKKAKLPMFAAGKTGTSQDYRDAWFIGFTDSFICAVWVGNDNNAPMNGVSGGGVPAEIWHDIMLKAHGL